ncbi:hypothetical protein UK12_33695, partial [Saccharothrix sp. ST-888]
MQPRVPPARLQASWYLSDNDIQSMVHSRAVAPLQLSPAAAAPLDQAPKWCIGQLARRANDTGTDLAGQPIPPLQVARVCT